MGIQKKGDEPPLNVGVGRVLRLSAADWPFLLTALLASFAIGLLTDLIGAGRLLTVWPDMPTPLADVVNFFATTSMAQVMVFALIVVFLQFRPAGLFPQKGRMVEA